MTAIVQHTWVNIVYNVMIQQQQDSRARDIGASVRIDFWRSRHGPDWSSMYLTVKFTTSTSGVLLSAIRHPTSAVSPFNIRSNPKKWGSPIAEINTVDIGELSAFVESHGAHPKIPSATLHVMAVSDGGLHNTRTLELTRTILARLTPERFGWDVELQTFRYDIWDDDYISTHNVDGIAEHQSRTFNRLSQIT